MGSGKPDRSGRSKSSREDRLGAFTPMLHETMDSPAFLALSTLAQCVYLRLLRRVGYKAKRNGEVFYSVREGAAEFRKNKDTISQAFHELQAKGLIVPAKIGALGSAGEGKATTWRLTAWPTATSPKATKEYLAWKPGEDFPVVKGKSPPRVKQNPVPESRTACPTEPDGSPQACAAQGVSCPSLPDVLTDLGATPVLSTGTPKDLPGGRGAAVMRVWAIGDGWRLTEPLGQEGECDRCALAAAWVSLRFTGEAV